MPLFNALGPDICASEAKQKELGPAVVLFSRYCAAAAADVWFKAFDQRDDLTLQINEAFLDIQTQASATPTKQRQGKTLQLNLSIGAKSTDLETFALLTGSTVKTDATNTEEQSVDIVDTPGNPDYFQVVIIPVEAGNILDFSYGIVMEYALVMTDNAQLVFSPSTPKNLQFSLFGEPHPVSGLRGRVLATSDGSDHSLLLSAASEYIAVNPQS